MSPDTQPSQQPTVENGNPASFDTNRLFTNMDCIYANYSFFLLQRNDEFLNAPAIYIVNAIVKDVLTAQPDDLTLSNLDFVHHLGIRITQYLSELRNDDGISQQLTEDLTETMMKVGGKTNSMSQAIQERRASQPQTPAEYIQAVDEIPELLNKITQINLVQELSQFSITDFNESSCRYTIKLGEGVLLNINKSTDPRLNKFSDHVDLLTISLKSRLANISSVKDISQQLTDGSLDPNQAIEQIREQSYPCLIDEELLLVWDTFLNISLDDLNENSIYYLDSIGHRISKFHADDEELTSKTDERRALIQQTKQKKGEEKRARSAPEPITYAPGT
jgi:hypothetical protein